MQIIPKKIAGILIAAIILTAALSSTAIAASWNPNDLITITVRVYDQTTGFAYTVGTDTCTKGDQNIQSDAYRIPQLTQFVDASKFGTVTKVVGNWYFPAHDSSVGATVNWSCNASTATMTYWVTSYNPQGSSGSGSTQPSGSIPTDAIWKFNLQYDLAGGTNASNFPTQSYGATSKYEKSHTFTTHSVTPVKEGYVFKYWQQSGSITTTRQLGENVLVSATGIDGYNGGTVTDKLTAVWEKVESVPVKSVTVTYVDRDETYATQNHFNGDTVTVIDNSNTNDGYTFAGWDTSSAASTVVYETADTFVVNGDTTLYAVWNKNADPDPDPETTYTVTYTDGVDGKEIFADQTSTVTAGGNTSAFDGTPTREGYVFAGWSPTVSDTVNGNVTYTALWKEAGEAGNDKISEPGMDKKADGEAKLEDVKPGQIINFTLNSSVGEDMADQWNATTGWENAKYELVFHDTLTGPITFNENSVKVTLGGEELTNEYYTLNTNPGNDETFTLTVDCVKALKAGLLQEGDIGRAAVVVAYTATVNADAANGAEVSNTAYVNDSAIDTLEGTVNMPPTPPSTGGAGTLAFTLLGLTMTCGAAAAFVVRRKRA